MNFVKNLKLKDIKPFFEIISNSKNVERPSNIKTLFEVFKNNMSKTHGAVAEANTSSFIRNRIGHSLSKTDVIIPDYYDLKRGYSIAEYSDELLPKSTSDVDFSQLGLIYTDAHAGNKVAGKIIDIGGVITQEAKLQDKLTLRFYKKIMNQKNPECQRQYINKLKADMKHMNFLDKQKIQDAINLAYDKFGFCYI